MKEPILSRALQQELVTALGLPLDGCMSVEIEMPSDGYAAAVVRYHLPPEALLAVAESMNREGK